MWTPCHLRVVALAMIVVSAAVVGTAHAAAPAKAAKAKAHRTKAAGPLPWCAEELETLPNGLCYIDGAGAEKGEHRTLVVFLHGMIAKDVDWQWLQARALARQAKQNKFEAVFARAPLGPSGYVWPGTLAAQETSEQTIIDGWDSARAFLEQRSGKPYDEVFLMGFSSGAYFVSALALRGRVKYDGYAVFAGGSGGFVAPDITTKAPAYVGVCTQDAQTANHSRAFGSVLAAHGWPHHVDEQRVGHMFADIHVAHAIAYLRKNAKKLP